MTSPAEAMLGKLVRVGGFTVERLLDDDLGVELTGYVRDTAAWRDIVMVYNEAAVRAHRRRTGGEPGRDSGGQDGPRVDPADVERLIPLDDAVSVVDEVLGGPADEPEASGDGAR